MASAKGLQYCGCVAGDAVEEVGAGSEAWIEDPSVVVAITGNQIAVAKKRTLVMQLAWTEPEELSVPVVIRIGDSNEYQEDVTSLEWLVFDDFTVLAAGTSLGALLLYTQRGVMLFRQQFHSGPVLRMRARQDCNLIQGITPSEDVCIVFPKHILRIDVLDIHTLLRRILPSSDWNQNGRTTEGQYGALKRSDSLKIRLAYELWNVCKSTASIADGALACVMAPPLLEHQSKRDYCALTIGDDSTLVAFRVSGEKRNSLVGVVFDKVVPAAMSTISSLTKRFWKTDPTSETNRPTEVTPQAFGRATLITALRDQRRRGVSLALSPSGSLAAVTDSLGRVSLVDVQALVAVRLWKGYREAHCMFLEAPLDGRQSYGDIQTGRNQLDRDEFSLCLAIHAPRRGVVEVWQMRYGARLTVIRCVEGCRLVQPSCKFKFSNELLSFALVDEDEFVPARVYITAGNSGVLSLLNPFLQPS